MPLVLTAVAAGQSVIRVDDSATGTADGDTWPNAYPTREPALADAMPGDTILLAHGTYVPANERVAGQPRTRTFMLKGGVTVIGGYLGLDSPAPGGGTSDIDNPDGQPQLTVLSGGIGSAGTADNCFNVVFAPDQAALRTQGLERVTIRDGRADGVPTGTPEPDPEQNGAAVYCSGLPFPGGGRLRLEECIFTGNYAAEAGGAVFYEGENVGDAFFGAVECFAFRNEAGERGGAFALGRLGYETFIVNDGSYLMNCTLLANRAGAAATDLANAGGGGVWFGALDTFATLQTSNNRVINNLARGRGGAYAFSQAGRLRVANDTIFGNAVEETRVVQGTQRELPCAVFFGSGFDPMTSPSLAFFRNNIVWGNRGSTTPTSPNIGTSLLELGSVTGSGTVTVEFNDITVWAPTPIGGGTTPTYPGTGNINADPLFVNAAGLDFSLQDASPCIDAGLNAAINQDFGDLDRDTIRLVQLPMDFRRSAQIARIINQTVDMGAYEQ